MTKKKQSNPDPPKGKRPKPPPGPPRIVSPSRWYIAMNMKKRMDVDFFGSRMPISFPEGWVGVLPVYSSLDVLQEQEGDNCPFTLITEGKKDDLRRSD
jgi:hypothetical protein